MHRNPHRADIRRMNNVMSPPTQSYSNRPRVTRIVGCVAAAAVIIAMLPISAAAAPKSSSVTVADVVVSESAGTASFTIKAKPRPQACCALSVDWTTADGTATQPADYTTASGTVTLTRSASTTIVSVPVTADALNEPNEAFTLNLSNLTGSPGKIGDAQAVGTITDDDPLPTLSIDDVIVGEGDAGTKTASFSVSLSAPSGRTVTVDWATADGNATQPADYGSDSGSATFAPGDTSENVDVTVNGDTELEADETFSVALTNPTNATVSDASGTGTILADEVEPVVSIGNAAVTEGNAGSSTLSFTVSLSRPGLVTATVDWATSDGTATAPGDFTDTSSTVTFTPGDVEEAVEVPVNADTQYEVDETLIVDLSNPTDSFMGDGQGVGTITNDDPVPSVSISDASVAEGNAGTTTALFDLTLSAMSGASADVVWTTVDGSALAGLDHVAASGTVSFAPGDVSETISVTINGDTIDEPNEGFNVVLSAPNGAVISDGTGSGTIVDDDKTPTALTLRVRKGARRVVGTGRLEPAKIGFKVTVSLFRKRANGTFVRLRSKTVAVKSIRDRDGDDLKEGVYLAPFPRPKTGTYRMAAKFKGTATHRASTKQVTFTLS
jgi:Calx-beta domain-containing protein